MNAAHQAEWTRAKRFFKIHCWEDRNPCESDRELAERITTWCHRCDKPVI